MDTVDDEHLHRLLADAEPPAPTADVAVLASLAQLNRRVAAQESAQQSARDSAQQSALASGTSTAALPGDELSRRRGRRRLSRGARVGLIALAGTLALSGTAAAAVHAARTGWFGAPGMTENDTTEWLDSSAPDFPDVVESLRPAYVTFAPGTDAASAAAWTVMASRASGGMLQETLVARSYATYGQCSWAAAWLASTPGDAAHTTATDQLAASAEWPVFAATDGGGIVAEMREMASAARAENAPEVERLAELGCSDALLHPHGGDSASPNGATTQP
ncbi:hypothetical protein SAMN06264364_1602 [Quadrisphaera granulorum]|uniref:Uncharacterized protein n=1 Tax=Quadrisphaera granulorum TaxID=317664 RepID=A0A315ZIM4_9ACTN|nr:hypothetical protein [Quadrisphaera granulorum]PWJ45152.1 hypothetical protein BXY45_1602 [Quadrisphaera granulorum]SZE99195.1 hypothetical protein SAMN06264364_1602 [Quadrisphaera granulorum]